MNFSLTPEQAHERRWWTLAALCLALTIIGIDNTILNVAVPSIVGALNPQGSQLLWIFDSYTIVFACLLLTAGTLGDKFGRRKTLLAGLFFFGLFSGLGALSQGPNALILFRGLMGVGGAFIYPSTLSILTNTFQGAERAKAIGIWAGVSGLGIAIGPVTGGFLAEHFFWGSVFLVNVPLCIIAIVMTIFVVPEIEEGQGQKLDLGGAILSIIALSGLLFTIIEVPEEGFTATPVLVSMAVTIVFGTLFALWERRVDEPMLDLSFFANPRFSAASATITLTFFALFGGTFLLSQYFQFALGFSPLKSGLMTAPVAIGIVFTSPRTHLVVGRLGTKYTVMLGLAMVALALSSYSVEALVADYVWGSLIRVMFGVGMGLIMAPATESIMGAIPLSKAGVGSAINDTTRQVGGALGMAVIGSIYVARYRNIVDIPDGLPNELASHVEDSIGQAHAVARTVGEPLQSQIIEAANTAYVSGMRLAVFIAAGVMGIAAFVAWKFLPHRAAPIGGAFSAPANDAADSVQS